MHGVKSKPHDGKQEMWAHSNILFGQDIINQFNSISFLMLSKKTFKMWYQNDKWQSTMTKISIFLNISYWQNPKLRHKLGVMHIKKNICDNLVGTILNIDEKTKVTIKAHENLSNLK